MDLLKSRKAGWLIIEKHGDINSFQQVQRISFPETGTGILGDSGESYNVVQINLDPVICE